MNVFSYVFMSCLSLGGSLFDLIIYVCGWGGTIIIPMIVFNNTRKHPRVSVIEIRKCLTKIIIATAVLW